MPGTSELHTFVQEKGKRMKKIAMNRIVIMVVTAIASNAGLWLATAAPEIQAALCGG